MQCQDQKGDERTKRAVQPKGARMVQEGGDTADHDLGQGTAVVSEGISRIGVRAENSS